MPSFELPIRSLSILFIFGALIAILWFPDNPHTPNLARAFFWWFLALGVVKWIEKGLNYLLPRNANGILGNWQWVAYLIAIPSLVAQVWFLILGIRYFFSVLATL